MTILEAHSENQNVHAKHKEVDVELCRSMDSASFTAVLNKLVVQGMKSEMVSIFETQFQALLASVKTENNRLTPWMPL